MYHVMTSASSLTVFLQSSDSEDSPFQPIISRLSVVPVSLSGTLIVFVTYLLTFFLASQGPIVSCQYQIRVSKVMR